MPRLITHAETMRKLAALQVADMTGRSMAQDRAVEELAKTAGVLLARRSLSPAEYELLKEAGLFSRIGGAVSSGAQSIGGAVKGTLRKVRGRLSSAPSRTMQGFSRGEADLLRRGGVKPGEVKAPNSRTSGWGSLKPKEETVWGGAKRTLPKEAPAGMAPGPRPAPAGDRTTGWGRGGSSKAGPAKAPTEPPAQGPYRSSSNPQPQAQAPQQAPQAAQRAPANQPTQQAPAQQQGSRGTGWGRMALYGGAGLGAYGLYKGIGWGARQLEQTSTSPMAYGGGWSPTAYGYGPNPYGEGSPNMGYGS